MMTNRGVALYVHIPFCEHICYYCDFCHRKYNRDIALRWLDEFKIEFKERVINQNIKTIYLGGGTPTALDYDILEEVLKTIDLVYDHKSEYTIEINPENFDSKKALLLKKYGINRASIGLESSNDEELKSLGRHHSFCDVLKTVDILKEDANIDNFSLDIIYSFPSQTIKSFEKTIDDALSLKPKHLSLYSLTVEENTVFGKRKVKSFDEDIEAEFYELALSKFESAGYHQYEVSNFCIDNYQSRHNLAYWYYDDFIGISMGASSKINHKRIDNTRDINKYCSHDYYDEITILDIEDEKFEMIMMGLRLNEGLNINRYFERFNSNILDDYYDVINKEVALGNIIIKDNHIICTNLEILNTVLVEFL